MQTHTNMTVLLSPPVYMEVSHIFKPLYGPYRTVD